MGRARARVGVAVTVAEAEALWLDPWRWPAFVDGCAAIEEVAPGWPAEGEVVWRSTPEGRGRVVERVADHRPGQSHQVEVDDATLSGRQTVRFAAAAEGSAVVELELRYRVKGGNPLTPLIDVLFIRRAVRDALRRTLGRYARELEAGARTGWPGP